MLKWEKCHGPCMNVFWFFSNKGIRLLIVTILLWVIASMRQDLRENILNTFLITCRILLWVIASMRQDLRENILNTFLIRCRILLWVIASMRLDLRENILNTFLITCRILFFFGQNETIDHFTFCPLVFKPSNICLAFSSCVCGQASYITMNHIYKPNSAGRVESMDNLRGIIDTLGFPKFSEPGLPQYKCMAYCTEYMSYETNKVLFVYHINIIDWIKSCV